MHGSRSFHLTAIITCWGLCGILPGCGPGAGGVPADPELAAGERHLREQLGVDPSIFRFDPEELRAPRARPFALATSPLALAVVDPTCVREETASQGGRLFRVELWRRRPHPIHVVNSHRRPACPRPVDLGHAAGRLIESPLSATHMRPAPCRYEI